MAEKKKEINQSIHRSIWGESYLPCEAVALITGHFRPSARSLNSASRAVILGLSSASEHAHTRVQ
jgi:hypothetical protein